MDSVLGDLGTTVDIMCSRAGTDTVEMDVGVNYAGFVRAELRQRGVEIEEAAPGDEVNLSFSNGRKVRLLVH